MTHPLLRRVVAGAALALAPSAPSAAPSAAPSVAQEKPKIEALLERAAHGQALTDAELERILAETKVEEVDVRLVMVPIVVVDRRNRAIAGLVKDDFRVEDPPGRPRPISWFSEEMNRPFRLAVLLDVSESMSLDEMRRRLEEALVPLAREVGLVDRIMLLTFSDFEVEKLTGWSDRPMAVVQDAIAAATHGRTAIVDALALAARQFPETPKERQAIVLVTDGMDNASQLTVDDAVEAARSVDVPVYVMLLGGLDRQIQARRYTGTPLEGLAEVAEQTGGRWFVVGDREQAELAAARVRDDLRHQYWLAFQPPGGRDGRFRPITVKVDKSGARVRTRAGYR